MFSRNLLRLRDMKFITVIIQQQSLLGPGLIYLAIEKLSNLFRILLEDISLLDIHDSSLKILTDVQDASTAECRQWKELGVLVSDFVVGRISSVFLDSVKASFGYGDDDVV